MARICRNNKTFGRHCFFGISSSSTSLSYDGSVMNSKRNGLIKGTVLIGVSSMMTSSMMTSSGVRASAVECQTASWVDNFDVPFRNRRCPQASKVQPSAEQAPQGASASVAESSAEQPNQYNFKVKSQTHCNSNNMHNSNHGWDNFVAAAAQNNNNSNDNRLKPMGPVHRRNCWTRSGTQ